MHLLKYVLLNNLHSESYAYPLLWIVVIYIAYQRIPFNSHIHGIPGQGKHTDYKHYIYNSINYYGSHVPNN